LELFVGFGDYFLDLLEVIHADILVAVRLEDFTGDLAAFKALGVNEVAVFTPSAAIGSVEVAAGHGAEVARLDDRVHIDHGLLS